jgi:Uma2 family endonuclease
MSAVAVQPADATKWTYEEFCLFPDDGRRHELIDGERYVSPSPRTKHQTVSGNLFFVLATYIRKHRTGQLWAAPMDVVLSDLDVVEPDLLYVSAARGAIITEKNIQGAPDLVVEILSEGSRRTDEVIKRKLYETYGIPEYWIVDPELEQVRVYKLTRGRYVRTSELSRETSDRLTSDLFPSLTIPTSELFE